MEQNLETTLAEYSEIEAGIAALREKYRGRVYDVTTTAGMKDARLARAEIRGQRTELEKIRKMIKAPALERCRLIDGQAKQINAALLEVEEPIDKIIKDQEAVKAAEKAERERVERKRIEDIQDRIADFNFLLSEYHPSADIKAQIDRLSAVVIDDTFAEFKERANTALAENLDRAREAFDKAEAREVEEAQKEAERQKELAAAAEKQRAALAKAEEERKAAEAKAAEERKAHQAEVARLTAEREAKEKAERERLEAEEKEREKAAAAAAEQEREKEMLEAKRESHLATLKEILEVCHNETWSHANKVRRITVLAEANILKGENNA